MYVVYTLSIGDTLSPARGNTIPAPVHHSILVATYTSTDMVQGNNNYPAAPALLAAQYHMIDPHYQFNNAVPTVQSVFPLSCNQNFITFLSYYIGNYQLFYFD